MRLLGLAAIVGALPVTLTNGTTADATQVMSDLNWIVNQVNANAAPLATAALVNANNNFTAVQSGVVATSAANFPIASQVQNSVFSSLSSTLGTNALTARVAALPLAAYAAGQVFTFIPSQTNSGPASITVDAAGSTIIFSMGSTLVGGELRAGIPAMIELDGSKANLLNPSQQRASYYKMSLSSDVLLTNTAQYFDGPRASQGSIGTWLVSASATLGDTAGTAGFLYKLWDGVTVEDSGTVTIAATLSDTVSATGIFVSPAGDIRLSIRDASSTSGKISFNGSGNGKDATITLVRIA